MKPQLIAGVLILTLANQAVAADEDDKKLKPAKCGSVARLHVLNDVYLASQPMPEDFAVAKKKGIKTVINLRTAPELTWDEKKVVEKLGMKYHHLPFGAASSLTDELLDKSRELLNDKKSKPILLHCASANRVGAIWLAHRVLDDKIAFDAALAEASTVGLRSRGYLERVKTYVEKQK